MQLLDRLVAIIEAVTTRPEGAGLADIAKTTGLAPGTVHRLLGALTEAHLLERDVDSRRFLPGVGLVRIAGGLASAGFSTAADTTLGALRDRWQEGVYLTRLIDDGVVCVRAVSTSDPNRMSASVPVGRQMGVHASASGKAIAALVDDETVDRLLGAGGGLQQLTALTITDRATLDRDLAMTRERGYAVCDQETEIGVAALAVAIVGPDGHPGRSIGVIGPRERVLAARDAGLVDDLVAAARFLGSTAPVALPAVEPVA